MHVVRAHVVLMCKKHVCMQVWCVRACVTNFCCTPSTLPAQQHNSTSIQTYTTYNKNTVLGARVYSERLRKAYPRLLEQHDSLYFDTS